MKEFGEYLEAQGTSLDDFLCGVKVKDEVDICLVCDEAMFTFTLETPAGDLIISNATNHFGCLTLMAALKEFMSTKVIIIGGSEEPSEDDVLAILQRVLSGEERDDTGYPYKN